MTEIEELSSEVRSLDNAPDPTDYAADIAALQDSLSKLDDKVFRIDMRTTGLPQLVDDNYAWFEGCIDDLLALQNDNPLSGNGLVC